MVWYRCYYEDRSCTIVCAKNKKEAIKKAVKDANNKKAVVYISKEKSVVW